MKNSLFSKFRTTLKNIPAMRILVIASLLLLGSQLDLLHAQGPRLSFQGILKKANGDAVTDGTYKLTFRLYTTATGPISAAVWDEIQNDVDVISGIYSTVLGNDSTLNVSFNQLYYLGVTVGSTEMTPRIQLTSAPYALALIGTTNQFPSSGMVLADTLNVKTNVRARVGAPGAGGVNKNGYAFNGTNGDKDSGLFSTGLGQVSLYSDNVKMLTATPDSVAIRGDLRLKNNANINYNGLDDWRLVETDYFQNNNDLEGWAGYAPASGQYNGWNNPTPSNSNPTILGTSNNTFEGAYLVPANNTHALKKQFTIPNAVGNYDFIKIKFKYYVLDVWEGDDGGPDQAFGAIAKDGNGTGMVVGYKYEGKSTEYYPEFNTADWNTKADFNGGGYGHPDFIENKEMVFNKCNNCNNSFWLIFGASLNNPPPGNQGDEEGFGLGMIEIWVK